MRNISYLLVGFLFGIVMTKSEAISWFRIQEMFRFQSFHMYGIIGVAVVLGVILHIVLKRSGWKNADGEAYEFADKPKTYKASLFGGIFFGLGWAMTGACPGPLYVLVGNGYWIILLVVFSAILGTFTYGALKKYLPH